MHVAILAPSDRTTVCRFLLEHNIDELPVGYSGAPFIGTIIRELLEQNHQVTAITTSVMEPNDFTVKKFAFDNFTWIVIPQRLHSFRINSGKFGYMLDFFSHEQDFMLNCLIDIAPDFVHAHWSYEFAGAAIKSKIPHLVTVHDNAFKVLRFFKNIYRFYRLLMAEYNLKKVRFASTVSPYMKPYVQRRVGAIKVIPNPVAVCQSFDEVLANIERRAKTLMAPRFVMINNGWDERKNGICGLLAFKQVQHQFPNATLHLFGRGAECNGSANIDARKLGLANVTFNGSVPNDQLLAELSRAHVLIHPALEESFGVVLIEAMSMGIPVFGGASAGAVPWVVDDERLLVDVTKPEEIAKVLVQLLKDPVFYRDISAQVFKNVSSRFSSKSVVDNYLTYYDEIISSW